MPYLNDLDPNRGRYTSYTFIDDNTPCCTVNQLLVFETVALSVLPWPSNCSDSHAIEYVGSVVKISDQIKCLFKEKH